MTGSAMSERELSRQVVDLAEDYGWMHAHFGNTIRYVKRGPQDKRGAGVVAVPDKQARGFPDYVFCRERVIFVELKRLYNKPKAAQQDWLRRLTQAGQEVYVWTERDLREGVVERVLKDVILPTQLARLVSASGDVDLARRIALYHGRRQESVA